MANIGREFLRRKWGHKSSSLAFGQAQPPGPVVKYQFRTAGLPQPARFNVAQNILNFEPGAATPFHTHPGQVLVTVLEGENTFIVNGAEKVYKAGDSFIELPGEVAQARNAGTAPTRVMASFLIPPGAPLSMPQMAPAALPNTGAADTRALNEWLLVFAVIGLSAGAWLLRRWHRQQG